MAHHEDEDTEYERIRQSDIDDEFAYELALAAARRAQTRGNLTAGLLRHFGVRYEDLKGRRPKR